MAITDIRLIDHPKGREAMIGWLVSTAYGDGIIRAFLLAKPHQSESYWVVKVEVKGELLECLPSSVMTK